MKSEKDSFLSRGCKCSPKPHPGGDKIFNNGCCKFDVNDWMKDVSLPPNQQETDIIEVRFKNNRKEYFRNPEHINLNVGDIVSVEVNPGHDVGIVSITGNLVLLQLKKKKIDPNRIELKKVYRKAKPADIEKWIQAVELEDVTMFKARKIAVELNLSMKINDIEYQGDKTKAIFYYTADDRVDFRELIKIMAEKFMVRIEMRQIGARQEASRLGGIGSCGRELCCATFMSTFKTVSTNSARNQQLSLNPQKLTGLCSKLKCCLNYENSWYTEALKNFPDINIYLKTKKGMLKHQKTDVIKGTISYSYIDDKENDMFAILIDNVRKIIKLNSEGIFPEDIDEYVVIKEKKFEYGADITMEDITKLNDKESKDGVQ
jgi:cell fate regulator YaaT (PSP1 superfamily)